MMEIVFTSKNFTHQKIVFAQNLAVLIGKHGCGKTTVLDNLASGLKGKTRKFLVNDQTVKPGDYQVIYVRDHFDFEEETKLTKSSPFRNQLLKTINHHLLGESHYQDVVEKITKLAQAVEKTVSELFAKDLKAITNEDIVVKFGVEKINLENIIDRLLDIELFDQKAEVFLNKTTFNKFLLRMVVFSILQKCVDDDQQRPVFILFDNPELYTNPNTTLQLIQVLKKLLKNPNFYLLIASNSIDFLLHLEIEAQHINWIKNNLVFQILKPQQTIEKATAFYHFLNNKNHQDWFLYQNDFWKIFQKEDLILETKNFYANYGRDFFHLFFLDEVTLEIDKKFNNFLTKVVLEKNQYLATIKKDKKGIIFLATFIFNLSFLKLNFSEKTNQNHPQIIDFFSKKE